MPRITITGAGHPVDGIYTFDYSDQFDGDELHLIKKHAGVRVGEMDEAMTALDYDLIVAFAKIALDRAGVDCPLERLMKLKVGQILFEQTDEEKQADLEEEQLPPVSAPTGAHEPASKKSSSGVSSENGSDSSPVSDQLDTGSLASEIGSRSALEISAS